MFVVLKIPVAAALWLVWWASRAPEPDDGRSDEDGNDGGNHPRSPLPRPPRRGPHADPPPGAPGRIRVAARERQRTRH